MTASPPTSAANGITPQVAVRNAACITPWFRAVIRDWRVGALHTLIQDMKKPYEAIVTAMTGPDGNAGAVSTPRPTRQCSSSDHAIVRPVPNRSLILGATMAPTRAPAAATDMAAPKTPTDKRRPRYARIGRTVTKTGPPELSVTAATTTRRSTGSAQFNRNPTVSRDHTEPVTTVRSPHGRMYRKHTADTR